MPSKARQTTRPWGSRGIGRRMLCFAACAAVVACGENPDQIVGLPIGSGQSGRTLNPASFTNSTPTNAAVHRDSSSADATPSNHDIMPSGISSAPGQPAQITSTVLDPRARSLIEVLQREARTLVPSGTIVVSVGPIENVSHATLREFDTFRARLSRQLNEQAIDQDIRFSSSPDAASVRLTGSAYLHTMDGLDQWELIVRLKPIDEEWVIWEPSRPVRVIRIARPDQPFILQSGLEPVSAAP